MQLNTLKNIKQRYTYLALLFLAVVMTPVKAFEQHHEQDSVNLPIEQLLEQSDNDSSIEMPLPSDTANTQIHTTKRQVTSVNETSFEDGTALSSKVACNHFSPYEKYFFKMYEGEGHKTFRFDSGKTAILRVFRGVNSYDPVIFNFKHNAPCSPCSGRYRINADYTKEIPFPNGGQLTIESPERQFSSICVAITQK